MRVDSVFSAAETQELKVHRDHSERRGDHDLSCQVRLKNHSLVLPQKHHDWGMEEVLDN